MFAAICTLVVWQLAGNPLAQTATLQVSVTSDSVPVEAATVVVNGASHQTASDGSVSIVVTHGTLDVNVSKTGFAPATTRLELPAGQTQRLQIDLLPQPTVEEEVIVSATRTGRRLEDQPMRVETLNQEEIEEKVSMTPGDIVMMLNEMGGMRVQATSPALGAASVRIQGMQGRYTRFFSDGLPLFGEVGGLGLLQIPPMDLGQVEVIKGVASSLYGAGAMGGIVNLVSRRPGETVQRELLLNRSTRGATDAVAWYASPAKQGWSFTALGGAHWQEHNDVDGDSWSDLPHYSRAVVRPRVFWDGGNGRTFFATAGVTAEGRSGGGTRAEGPYREALDTRRWDVGAVAQTVLRQRYLLSARTAIMQQRHDHIFGEIRERDRHDTVFGELTARGTAGRNTWVIGGAFERNTYQPTEVTQFAYAFNVPGVFLQNDVSVGKWLIVSASGRFDHHSEYGSFFSPRVSAVVRAGAWTSRLSAGTGFFGASPLTEETEAAGLSRLVVPQPLRAEQGRSGSFDVGRTDGPFSYTVMLFASRVDHPLEVDRATGLVLTNASGPATNVGTEMLGTFRRQPYAITANYTYVRPSEGKTGSRTDAALTPRHAAGVVAMWEREGVGRVGAEFYYTGMQRLEENPYAERSHPYTIIGVLAERQVGHVRVFVNGENLTSVRQTRWHPMQRPLRAADGRWTVDAWAPLEGRNINGGVRLSF